MEIARAAKFLGNSLEAKVVLEATPDQEQFLKSFGNILADVFIVSQVEFGKAKGDWVYSSEELTGLKVGIEKAEGQKCVRCWKYSTFVSKDPQHPDLCQRCVGIVTS
ncbi:MAG: hypothetical protein A3H42_04185 [Deltaproteobacteria bacterium RIFCSPLOWO2_02_FULL_46_8]|nr:MAG: hypothetical protein A3H42_04185 [Deltaproteobacteria bacterium RIFCSPLOWO2_02_FULL_46_8]